MKHIFYAIVFVMMSVGSLKSQCTMVCNADLFVSLDEDGLAEITPDMIFEGDTTGCNFDFLVSVTLDGIVVAGPSVTLTCDNIGPWVVTLTDLTTGNACWSTVNIQDPGDNCNFGGPAFVANGICFSAVDLLLDGTDPIEGECLWVLPTLSPGAHNVEVIQNGVEPLNGVSTLDFVLMLRGIIQDNLSPREAIASDIDNDGAVSTVDMITIRQVILGIDDASEYDIVRMYRQNEDFGGFSPYDMDDYTVIDFTAEDFETINNILVRMVHAGDLNDTAFGGINSEDEPESRSSYELLYEDRFVEVGEEVELLIAMTDVNELQGLSTSLLVTDGEWTGHTSTYSDFELMSNVQDNEFKVSYVNNSDNQDFNLTVNFIAGQSGYISEQLSIGNSLSNDLVVNDQEYTIQLRGQFSSSNDDTLLEGTVVSVGSTLTFGAEFEGSQKLISLYDMNGRLISQRQTTDQIIPFQKSEIGYSGMYLVKWACKGKQGLEKLISLN